MRFVVMRVAVIGCSVGMVMIMGVRFVFMGVAVIGCSIRVVMVMRMSA